MADIQVTFYVQFDKDAGVNTEGLTPIPVGSLSPTKTLLEAMHLAQERGSGFSYSYANGKLISVNGKQGKSAEKLVWLVFLDQNPLSDIANYVPKNKQSFLFKYSHESKE